ncbi:MAG: hypothetical protein U0787_06255 [Polyangia bacterium]
MREFYKHKIADLKAATEALVQHPQINPNRIESVGVCLGTGYIAWAAVDNPRIKAVGGVVGYYRDVMILSAKMPQASYKVD